VETRFAFARVRRARAQGEATKGTASRLAARTRDPSARSWYGRQDDFCRDRTFDDLDHGEYLRSRNRSDVASACRPDRGGARRGGYQRARGKSPASAAASVPTVPRGSIIDEKSP